jgi:hypothetical protein
MNKFLYFLIIVLVFQACTKELDLEIPERENKVVVNSLFCPDSVMQIHVSLSSGIQEKNIQIVENATCYLYEDGILIKTINYQENGYYNSNYKAIAGKKYRIEVEVPNFEKVWAESEVPLIPDSLSGTYFIDYIHVWEDGYSTSVEIKFLDDKNKLNYYEPAFNTYIFEESKETDQSILSDSELDFLPTTYFFSDVLFNGQLKKLRLVAGGKGVFSFSGSLFYDVFYKHNFKIVSEEYYKFRKSWTKHVFNQNTDLHYDDPITLLFLGDPIEMYSNVQGGYGVFAAFNQEEIKIYFEE